MSLHAASYGKKPFAARGIRCGANPMYGLGNTLHAAFGNYVYNHYNTSAHDQWLQATPWGLDPSKRQSLSLAAYQNALVALMQAPSVQVGHVEQNVWWKSLLHGAKVGDIHLLLPGLDTAAFLAPMGAGPLISCTSGRTASPRLARTARAPLNAGKY
jgi:hypothetical protein